MPSGLELLSLSPPGWGGVLLAGVGRVVREEHHPPLFGAQPLDRRACAGQQILTEIDGAVEVEDIAVETRDEPRSGRFVHSDTTHIIVTELTQCDCTTDIACD